MSVGLEGRVSSDCASSVGGVDSGFVEAEF